MPVGYAHLMGAGHMNGVPYAGPTGKGPSRAMSRRWDNVFARPFRALVTRSSPDKPAGRSEPVAAPVWVPSVTPAQPFALRTVPTRRIGTVPKLSPGKQGTGLGQVVYSGFETAQYVGFTPMETSPANQTRFTLKIPRNAGVGWTPGAVVRPTYQAKPFRPAVRQFDQYRSAGMWAQAHYPPQHRMPTPSIQGAMVRKPSNVVRRQIPAGQNNAGLYTIGYPTRVGVAAQIGGGPIAVLGSNSQ